VFSLRRPLIDPDISSDVQMEQHRFDRNVVRDTVLFPGWIVGGNFVPFTWSSAAYGDRSFDLPSD
jgi:hypothetical protein